MRGIGLIVTSLCLMHVVFSMYRSSVLSYSYIHAQRESSLAWRWHLEREMQLMGEGNSSVCLDIFSKLTQTFSLISRIVRISNSNF